MAADSGRLREECAPAHTGSGRRLSATSYRVAKRSSDRSSARRPYQQVPQWHPRVAKGASIGTLARGPSTEALMGQGRVAKGRKSVPLTGLRSGLRPGLARLPCPQVLQRHSGVAKGASERSSARHPRLQIVLRQGYVAKRASIGTLARGPSTEALLGQDRVAKGRKSVPLTGLRAGLRPGLTRRPYQQVPQWHPRGATVSWCIG